MCRRTLELFIAQNTDLRKNRVLSRVDMTVVTDDEIRWATSRGLFIYPAIKIIFRTVFFS